MSDLTKSAFSTLGKDATVMDVIQAMIQDGDLRVVGVDANGEPLVEYAR